MLVSTLFLLWATFLQCVVATAIKRQAPPVPRAVLRGSAGLGGRFYLNFNGPLGETCHALVTFTVPPSNGYPQLHLEDLWCFTRIGHTRLENARAYVAVRDRGAGRPPEFQEIELGIDVPDQRRVLAGGLYRFQGAAPRINASVDRVPQTRIYEMFFNFPRQGAHCMADAYGESCGMNKRDPQMGFAHPSVEYCTAQCPK